MELETDRFLVLNYWVTLRLIGIVVVADVIIITVIIIVVVRIRKEDAYGQLLAGRLSTSERSELVKKLMVVVVVVVVVVFVIVVVLWLYCRF